jgi:hypothetical protein
MQRGMIATAVGGLVFLGAAGAAMAQDTVPPAEPQGCHGFFTVLYKQLTGEPGGQGSAIGGRGNSDQDPTNGQAHSEPGRGETLQQFLALACDQGSEAAAAAAAVGVLALGASGVAAAQETVPPADPEGCHGFFTVLFKQLTGDPGAQGSAIGGRGNSDQDPTNGQAHSELGRGATLQAFLAVACGVGSQAP